jgi:hypothetical protein
VARPSTQTKLRGASLRRLSVVFADPLRLKAVTELYMREMSPTLFFDQFGGGSVARVDRHFKKLAEHGWLRLVKTKTGGRRRGATEHFYRATELAVIDLERWSRLPESVRVAFTCRTYEQLSEQAQAAISAGTFDARSDRHLTWTPVLLDQPGWKQVIRTLDEIFESLLEEQEKARLRIAKSGETPILTTVALTGFESPARPTEQQNRPDMARNSTSTAEKASSPVPLNRRLAKVFRATLDLKIVTELNQRVMSPKQFYEEFGIDSLSRVSRHFKQLEAYHWLELVRTATGGRRRGAVEHFYRATEPAIFDLENWSEVPETTKETFSWRTFEQFGEQVREAIVQRSIDARVDRHFTWSLLLLDQPGWEMVISALDSLFESLPEQQESAKARMAESGETPIRMTVALAAFESPKDAAKAP